MDRALAAVRREVRCGLYAATAQKPWPQSVQKRAWRGMLLPQPGQLLCVLAMSNPQSWQKRPPCEVVWQLGQTMPEAWLEFSIWAPAAALASHLTHCWLSSRQHSSPTIRRHELHL